MNLMGVRLFKGKRSDMKHSEKYELGYWRKNYALFDYIYKNMLNEEDVYEHEISMEELHDILKKAKNGDFPRKNYPHMKKWQIIQEDVEIIQKSIDWSNEKDSEAIRYVVFQYSY